MGVITYFTGEFTTSRPLTVDERKEYNNEYQKNCDMYLVFTSNDQLSGIEDSKLVGYINMEVGICKTLNWLKSKNITLSGRINYSCEDIFSEEIGGGFGAFVATPEHVTYYKLDLDGLRIVSDVIY